MKRRAPVRRAMRTRARSNWAAREAGYAGAMYPWQTADDGREETPTIHYNPKSDAWDPDLSCRQRHVSIAVFYNAWRYVHDTGDTEFLNRYGAEMMFEIARFWSSIATFSPETGRYHIEGVMGPDEFHEELPGSGKHGVRDNSYTNIMTAWLLDKALEIAAQIRRTSPLGVGAVKRMVNLGADLSFDAAADLNDALRRPLEATKDYEEGIRAFFDKREAVFRGE